MQSSGIFFQQTSVSRESLTDPYLRDQDSYAREGAGGQTHKNGFLQPCHISPRLCLRLSKRTEQGKGTQWQYNYL